MRASSTPTRAPAQSRATFTLVLRAEPGNVDPIRNLRWLLKAALRRFGFRCVSATEVERAP